MSVLVTKPFYPMTVTLNIIISPFPTKFNITARMKQVYLIEIDFSVKSLVNKKEKCFVKQINKNKKVGLIL